MSTRVLVVDDHAIICDGLKALLNKISDTEVVGMANEGRKAVKMARDLQPDIVIMDLSMPGMGGIAATREMKAALPQVKIICLSVHSDQQFVRAALEAGASGYVLKDSSLKELVLAVRTVVRGGAYLSPGISESILNVVRTKRSESAPSSALTRLTNREIEVLQMIAEGHSTKEIAEQLCVTVKTVGTHRENLKLKLNVSGVAGLTKFAIRQGLTSVED